LEPVGVGDRDSQVKIFIGSNGEVGAHPWGRSCLAEPFDDLLCRAASSEGSSLTAAAPAGGHSVEVHLERFGVTEPSQLSE
jgi:hypothetical protein